MYRTDTVTKSICKSFMMPKETPCLRLTVWVIVTASATVSVRISLAAAVTTVLAMLP